MESFLQQESYSPKVNQCQFWEHPLLIKFYTMKKKVHENSQRNHSTRNRDSTALSLITVPELWLIKSLKKGKQKQSNCNRHTHHNLQLGMPIHLNIQEEVRLLLRKILRSTYDRNQHCGLPCDQAHIFCSREI